MNNITEKKDGEIREISKPFNTSGNNHEDPIRVVEKVVYVEKNKGFLSNIKRKIFFFGCLPLIFFIFLLCYISLTQTEPFWNIIVKTLNKGEQYQIVNTELTYEDVEYNLVNQLKGFGDNKLTLNNTEMTVLARNFFKDAHNITLNSKKDKLIIFWELTQQSDSSKNLLARIDIKIDEQNEPYISYVGFNRIGLPENISQKVFTILFPLLKVSLEADSPKDLLNYLLTGNTNDIITDIEFFDGRAEITININLDLFLK
jgi:hypothetical protein